MRSNDDDDGPFFRPPPAPDDRLWRHPSEVAPPVRVPSWTARHSMSLAALSALGGALVTSALWLAFAAPGGQTIRVRDQVAMAPVISVQPIYVSTDDWSTQVSTRASDALFPVEIKAGSSTRTGAALAVYDDGHLIVPAHLLVDAKSIVVINRNGARLPAEITGIDTVNDIGVIKVAEVLPIAVAGRAPSPDVNQAVALVGADGTNRPVWQTSVAAVDQPVSSQAPSTQLLFRIDTPIDASTDGGAIVDSTGAVIGIATIPPQASSRDGFAIPMSLARAVAWDLIKTGTTSYPALGFNGARTEGVRDRDGGVRVLSSPSGPAAVAGLHKDDIVVAADGKAMTSMTALVLYAHDRGVGTTISLDVLRNEKQIALTLALTGG